MSFIVEMLVSPTVTDDFGREAKATSTFLRYELRLGYELPSTKLARLGRLVLQYESLDYIKQGDAKNHVAWASKPFRDAVISNTRHSGSGFISTTKDDDTEIHTINIHQDGGSRGLPRPSPANTAPRTAVCTTNTASDPTILAARREMQSWRIIALEPTAMRSPDAFTAPTQIASNGAHMPASLYRLATQPTEAIDESDARGEAELDPRRFYTEVTRRLARLIDAREIRIDRDDRRELLTLELRQGTGGFFPARSLSDGTLRFLALSIMDSDPSVLGLICMEEPENGIHPERLPAMVELLQDIAVDAAEKPGTDNALRQVIVNTHSPGFVQLQEPNNLLFAKTVMVRVTIDRGDNEKPASVSTRALRLRPQTATWRHERDHDGVGMGEIVSHAVLPTEPLTEPLTEPPGPP